MVLALAVALLACSSSGPVEAPAPATPRASEPRLASAPSVSTPERTATPPGAQASGASKCHVRGLLPDAACTPGVADPRVTPDNIASTICVRGYTSSIRPPVSYTEPLKRQQMVEYGFTDAISAHEEDHLIPLELGGHPTDPRNLWPQPGASPNAKDAVEDRLHALVCAGVVPLVKAQHAIVSDWTTAVSVAGG